MRTVDDLRTTARLLFDAAVKAADPAAAVQRGFAETPPPSPKTGGRTIVIAVGKAAPAMLRAAMERLPKVDVALAVTHHENMALVPGAEVLRAGHPVPDEAGAAAADCVIELLETATENDVVVALISGGGSALLPAPPEGVSLAEKATLNDHLLAGGLDIVEMNMIRQQVSRLKGGGFSRLAAPAPVYAYLLSDVIGDDLRAIASGPTVSPIGTPETAINSLKNAHLWDRVPPSIQVHLETAQPAGAVESKSQNTLCGSNRLSLEAMRDAARSMGLPATIVSDHLTGDVADAADKIVGQIKDVPAPAALLFGGETTVKLTGTGLGGRNQELALRVAMAAPKLDGQWVFLSGGTDGRDGPTDAAGGLVDANTSQRIEDAGENAQALLANNDSHAALKAAGDLLITQATGTNVADVQVLLIAP
ncbi:glycerate kinase type-2 family protein [Marivita hallyeonensis]|uniref:Hydroxypyruvate reductase n=1 Tax=Marivita hallyeonensis TaxID=996342 RepID=A0A1M5PC38_9RHOB|nr:DUF4147 domain-containing protein [Marivita hallyeonensis]SHG99297.1 hydroxypyruvate reductase [Marivita hallyeonensis]